MQRLAVVILTQLFCFSSSAGVVPLKMLRDRAVPDPDTSLAALTDTVDYTLLADRIEAGEVVELSSGPSPVSATLGVPISGSKWTGYQDVTISVVKGEVTRRVKARLVRSLSKKMDIESWLSFRIRMSANQKLRVCLSWWQPYSQADLYGYPRLEFEDPLWTAGFFKGVVHNIVRKVTMTQGIQWSKSSPMAKEQSPDGDGLSETKNRVLTLSNTSPEPGQVFKVVLSRSLGALSACSGSNPWLSVDGTLETTFAVAGCKPEDSFIDLVSDCKGFGTSSPECNEAGVRTWDLGLSVRTADGKAHNRFVFEGYWGRKRVWKKTGRQNRPLHLGRAEHLTRYRIRFPGGFPAAGPGEISIVRFDPKLSTPGFEKILSSKGWRRMADRCMVLFELRNPASLRHAVLALRPQSKTDAYMLNMDCTDGRKREPFHEPIECHHSHGKYARSKYHAMGIDAAQMQALCKTKHFKRKNPWKIDLALDPKCVAYRFRLQAPPMLCSKRFHAVIPHIILDY